MFCAKPIRQLALRGLRTALPRRQLLVRGKSCCRSVHLTFDDGPCEINTPRILDSLRHHGATATFFIVGEQARKNPKLIRRIVDEGHEIGGHTYSHHHRRNISLRELQAELEKTDETLRRVIGHSTTLFRPPYGKLKAIDLPAIWRSGRTIVLWSCDPKDFATDSRGDLTRWFRNSSLAAGDVVLLHDTSEVTADALDEILMGIQSRGLQCSGCGSAVDRDWHRT